MTVAPGGGWTAAHSTALLRSPLLACNYHRVLPENRGAVERRLRRLVEVGPSLDLDADATRPSGREPAAAPRIVVGFYDSYREAGLFGADLCHRLGIRAYFFPLFEPFDEPGTASLTDADLADIGSVHEVGFHTSSHRSAVEVTEAMLGNEVATPFARIAALAGRPPRIGAWRGGARFDDALPANRLLRDLGLRYVMSNWSVEVVPGRRPEHRTAPVRVSTP